MKKEERKIFSELNTIALPLILSSISSVVMGIVDQSLVGRISIHAYAGVGLVSSVIYSLTGVLGALSISFNILGSQSKGNDDFEDLNNKFTSSLIISTLIGILLFSIVNLLCVPILQNVFGLQSLTLTEASEYIRIFSISILLNLVIFTYSSVFKIFRQTKHIFITSLIVNIINISLDYVLIFGKFGFPKLGSKGAAIGTIVALLINIIIYYNLSKKLVKINFKFQDLRSHLKKVFFFSIPLIGQEFMEDIVFVIGMNAIIARIGVVELSTYTLILQITNIILMPMFGYSTANLSLISEAIGKKDIKSSLDISKYSLRILLCIHFIMFIFIILFKESIPKIITSDKILIESVIKYMPIAIFIHVFNFMMTIYKSSLQSINYQNWTLKITFILNLFTLLIIMFIGKNFSLYGVYIFVGLSYLSNFIVFKLKYNKILTSKDFCLD